MMGRTHLVIGGAAWLALAASHTMPYYGAAAIAGGWFLSALAALGPDLDQKQSMGSRLLGPITQGISWVVRAVSGGHRKLTHSLLGMAIVLGLIGACITMLHLVLWVGLAIMVGWMSHIAADMITVEGCPLLYPVSRAKFGLHLMHTDHAAEHVLVLPLALLANLMFIWMVIRG